MVAEEFLESVEKWKLINFVGMSDFSDRINFQFTVTLYLLCITVITVKEYLMTSIACHAPNIPSGEDFSDYLANYCWIHGTIPLSSLERTPMDDEWDDLDKARKVGYYQWVPFILGLQCILFYLPQILWQLICFNSTGVDLDSLVESANDASHSTGSDRDDTVQHIASTLENMFFQHRIDAPKTRLANLRQKVYHNLTCCIVSRRLGTWLVNFYFLVKILSLINSLGQIFLMQHFLGFNSVNFGYQVLSERIRGRDWRNNLFFPRIVFCDAKHIRHLGVTRNRFIAQCVLPVNMLNEKLYIFLWFWTIIVSCLTLLSLLEWNFFICLSKRRLGFIRTCLRKESSHSNDSANTPAVFRRFVEGFLRHDGVFILRIISMNAGSLIASKVVTQLWVTYREKYNDMDFRNYIYHDKTNANDEKNSVTPSPPNETQLYSDVGPDFV